MQNYSCNYLNIFQKTSFIRVFIPHKTLIHFNLIKLIDVLASTAFQSRETPPEEGFCLLVLAGIGPSPAARPSPRGSDTPFKPFSSYAIA